MKHLACYHVATQSGLRVLFSILHHENGIKKRRVLEKKTVLHRKLNFLSNIIYRKSLRQ